MLTANLQPNGMDHACMLMDFDTIHTIAFFENLQCQPKTAASNVAIACNTHGPAVGCYGVRVYLSRCPGPSAASPLTGAEEEEAAAGAVVVADDGGASRAGRRRTSRLPPLPSTS